MPKAKTIFKAVRILTLRKSWLYFPSIMAQEWNFLSLMMLQVTILVQYPCTDTNTCASPAPDISSLSCIIWILPWIAFGGLTMVQQYYLDITIDIVLLEALFIQKPFHSKFKWTNQDNKHRMIVFIVWILPWIATGNLSMMAPN